MRIREDGEGKNTLTNAVGSTHTPLQGAAKS